MCYSSECSMPLCPPAGVHEHCQALCPCSGPWGLWVYFWLDMGWWLAVEDDIYSCTCLGPPTSQSCVSVPALLDFVMLPSASYISSCGGSSGLLWSSMVSLLLSLSVFHIMSYPCPAQSRALWAAECQGTRAAMELCRQLDVWCPTLPQPLSFVTARAEAEWEPHHPTWAALSFEQLQLEVSHFEATVPGGAQTPQIR